MTPTECQENERLNRYLARCGVASRRGADALIADGRVRVNGAAVETAGLKVDPRSDRVEVDGARVQPATRTIVVMLNKPRGVVSTVDDPHAERTLEPWLSRYPERLYPIGRLDRDSEGLLLLTNDGDLTLRLTHPRFHLDKEYRVTVKGELTDEKARRLRDGVQLEDGMSRPVTIDQIQASKERTRFTMTMREGRKRQIRRMCQAVELHVIRLVRNRVGPLVMSGLRASETRELTATEIAALRGEKVAQAKLKPSPRASSRSRQAKPKPTPRASSSARQAKPRPKQSSGDPRKKSRPRPPRPDSPTRGKPRKRRAS